MAGNSGLEISIFLIRKTLYQLKNFLSVLKKATTVYETETCTADFTILDSVKY